MKSATDTCKCQGRLPTSQYPLGVCPFPESYVNIGCFVHWVVLFIQPLRVLNEILDRHMW